MANKAPESSSSSPAVQGETPGVPTPQPGQPEGQRSSHENTISKTGPLLIASKGIGWTSWKKRWFVLESNSLVFYRSDPNATTQKNLETNLPLGGIDLNSSGSVDVKPDKKLLNVVFPDGRDGRTFTLKAETIEDLYEWKNTLETAIAQAPSATPVTGENGILNGEQAEAAAAKGPSEQQKDKPPAKSTVIGRPVLLALQDIDGSPSFLEKALDFIEQYDYIESDRTGVKTEGILRQAADVEEVERRVYEYEHGKTEFSPNEDAHVIADCVKHILRELPSAPVPASCCNALLDAFRADRSIRINCMRTAILETFPEPNRKLLQRILLMMQVVASHKAVNRMGTSAVAACMAPLLLRPLLAGDCEVENQHMDVAGDNSFQLLQAAAAANHAQAIIITLLDEYDQFFGEGSLSHDLFSEEEESGSEEGTEYEDDEMYEEEDDEDEYESDEADEDEDYGSDEPEEDEESGSDEDEGDAEDDLENLRSKTHNENGNDENIHSVEIKKNPLESTEISCDEQDELKSLEATKKHLETQLADEAKSNKVLQTTLAGRKRVLDERRLALECDVARLQEQLQNEREIRAALDAGLSISQIPISASVDEKVKAQLMEIAADEASINGLKQRVDDLGVVLNQQREENHSVMRDRGIHPPETPPHETTSRYKQKANSGAVEKSPKSKGKSNNNSNEAGRGIERTHESSSMFKKYTSKSEGNSTSALSKLTTRLNFLKERRNQIANELQNLDKGREPGQSPLKSDNKQAKQSDVSNISTDKKQENNESHKKSDSKIATQGDSSPHCDEDSDKGKASLEAHHMETLNLYESTSRKRSSKMTK
ncbi:hypothetical protein V2J09_013869 [Rumex salicifolius]